MKNLGYLYKAIVEDYLLYKYKFFVQGVNFIGTPPNMILLEFLQPFRGNIIVKSNVSNKKITLSLS